MANVAKREWTHKGETKTAWIVRYLAGGKHRQKTFDRKKDADAYRQKVERELFDGTHTAAGDGMTIEKLCDLFMKNQEVRMAQGTIGRPRYEQIKTAINCQIVPLLGYRTCQSLQSVDVEDWYTKLIKDNGLAPITAIEKLGLLKQVFKFAIRRKITKVEPVTAARENIGKVKQTKVKTFTPLQIKALIAAAEIKGYRVQARRFHQTKAILHLAIFCGLRMSEIRALRGKHVNFEKRVIEVRHSLTQWEELKGPKTQAGVRDVPMPDHLAKLLRYCMTHHWVDGENGFVFATDSGGPIAMSNFRKDIWYPLLERAGLRKPGDDKAYHFHALRHFTSSNLIASGVDLPSVAALIGHENFDMTLKVYAHTLVGAAQHHVDFGRMADKFMLPEPPQPPCAP